MNREEESRIISLRQSRVAELLAQGYTNQSEIARKLNISEPTVSRYTIPKQMDTREPKNSCGTTNTFRNREVLHGIKHRIEEGI
jgi:predicted transcriptional regulator